MTSQVQLTKFLDEVLLDAPGCEIPVALNAIRNAAIEVCKQTRCWQEYLDPLTVTAGTSDYDIESPAGAEPVCVMSAMLDSTPLDIQSPDWLDTELPDWRTRADSPVYLTQLSTKTVMLAPLPSAGGKLVIRAAFMPNRTASQVPELLFSSHLEVIAAGAKTRLLASPSKPYSNPDAAIYHGQLFKDGISSIRLSVDNAFGRSRLRATPRH